MLKCRDVPEESSLVLDNALPWRRRMALRAHLMLCRHCRRYLRQLRLLRKAWWQKDGEASEEEISSVMDACRRQATDEQGGASEPGARR